MSSPGKLATASSDPIGSSGCFAHALLSGNLELVALWLRARLLDQWLFAFEFPLRALRLGAKQTLHLPRPSLAGEDVKALSLAEPRPICAGVDRS
jgi:hypothetical protein